MAPVEPSPTRWQLPAVLSDDDDLVAFGADLEPGTLLAAYRRGLFPMPVDQLLGRSELAWWSPNPRGVLPLDRLRVSRSLRQSCRRFTIRVDTCFAAVIGACAAPDRPGGWINDEIRSAYQRLHELGWAHSVEAWTPDDQLAGGLYGVAVGGLFAGESMFHLPQRWARDSSKVALATLVELLRADGIEGRLLDVQWATPHLRSLGVVAVPRAEYQRRLRRALDLPLPAAFAGATSQAATGHRTAGHKTG